MLGLTVHLNKFVILLWYLPVQSEVIFVFIIKVIFQHVYHSVNIA